MKKRQFGERSRNFIVISVLLILVNLTLGVFLIRLSQEALITQIEGRMLDVSNTAADMLDGDELKNLKKEDKGTKEYQKVIDTLSGFWSNIQLKYIYCIQQVGEKEFAFSVDPTTPDPGEFGEPVVYTDALYEASKGVASVDKAPYEDAWGRFYSAYSPVFDSQGEVAGIVAVDFSADWYDNQVRRLVRTVLIASALSLLAGGMVTFLLMERTRKRNRRLYQELNSLAANVEDLVDEVNVMTRSEPSSRLSDDSHASGDDISDLSEKVTMLQEELRAGLANIHEMTFIDALTAVGNTAAYMEKAKKLDGQIAAGTAKFSVAAFDMNGLKRANDHYGHDSGDRMLIDTAAVICRVFGKVNVFRIGGDEFVALVPTDSADEMERLFEQFDRELEEENQKEKPYQYPISVSKGYSIYQQETDSDYKSVFRRADDTMYRDKDAYYANKADGERR